MIPLKFLKMKTIVKNFFLHSTLFIPHNVSRFKRQELQRQELLRFTLEKELKLFFECKT